MYKHAACLCNRGAVFLSVAGRRTWRTYACAAYRVNPANNIDMIFPNRSSYVKFAATDASQYRPPRSIGRGQNQNDSSFEALQGDTL